MKKEIEMHYDEREFKGHLYPAENSKAWIIFAHGSGSSRHSSRNNWVAQELSKQGFSTMLFDLLTEEEDKVYEARFNIPLLARRLERATKWLINSKNYHQEPIAYFGASTGAAAALMTAAQVGSVFPIYTIISRGGRPDLAGREMLNRVFIPTLLIVGGKDTEVISLNEMAHHELADAKLVLIPGATHLFEETGALREVVKISADWFSVQLQDQNFNKQTNV